MTLSVFSSFKPKSGYHPPLPNPSSIILKHAVPHRARNLNDGYPFAISSSSGSYRYVLHCQETPHCITEATIGGSEAREKDSALPYYRPYHQDGGLRPDVAAFHSITKFRPSKVWVVDITTTPLDAEFIGFSTYGGRIVV